jgi:hypothetical protein
MDQLERGDERKMAVFCGLLWRWKRVIAFDDGSPIDYRRGREGRQGVP